jgi:hypothetical protein
MDKDGVARDRADSWNYYSELESAQEWIDERKAREGLFF